MLVRASVAEEMEARLSALYAEIQSLTDELVEERQLRFIAEEKALIAEAEYRRAMSDRSVTA